MIHSCAHSIPILALLVVRIPAELHLAQRKGSFKKGKHSLEPPLSQEVMYVLFHCFSQHFHEISIIPLAEKQERVKQPAQPTLPLCTGTKMSAGGFFSQTQMLFPVHILRSCCQETQQRFFLVS